MDRKLLGESEVISSRRKIREYGAPNLRFTPPVYSTYITVNELREATHYPFATKPEDVHYPEKINVNSIPPALALDLRVHQRRKREAQRRPKKLVKAPMGIKVAHLNLECLNTLFHTVLPTGERRIKASKFLGIAYYLDHAGLEGFGDLAREFAEVQSQGNHKLTFDEVRGWKHGIEDWLAKGHTPEWNCLEIRGYLTKCGIDFNCPDSCPYKTPAIQAEQKETIFTPEVEAQAHEILQHGKPLDYVVTVGNKIHKGDSVLLRIDYLSSLTPMLPYQLPLETVGKTGKGKTHHMETALEFIPREYVIYVNDPSPKSFYYAQQKGIKFDQRVVVIDDVLEEHIPVLKTLTSQNVHAPSHWTVDNQEFMDLNIQGRFTVWTSSVSPLRDEQGQLSRRFLMVNPTEDPTLDEEVTRFILERRRRGLGRRDLPPEFEVVKCMTKILRQRKYQVLTPFEFDFPADPQRTSPTFFMSLLEASAVAHVYQRRSQEKDGITIVLADPEDFEEAKRCWMEYMLINLYKVDATALKILDVLPDQEPEPIIDENGKQHAPTPSDEAPTVTYLAKNLREGPRVVYDKLKSLYEAGLIDQTYFGSWNTAHYFWKTNLPEAAAEKIQTRQYTLTEEHHKQFLESQDYKPEDFSHLEPAQPLSPSPKETDKESNQKENSTTTMVEQKHANVLAQPAFACSSKNIIREGSFMSSKRKAKADFDMVQHVPPDVPCEQCGRHAVEYVITLRDGAILRKCPACFEKLKPLLKVE